MKDCDIIQTIFETNFHKVFKFNKKLVNHVELRFAAVVSTKKTLIELNDIFKKVMGIESIEIREYYE